MNISIPNPLRIIHQARESVLKKSILLILLSILPFTSAFSQLDPWYMDNDEIHAYLLNLQARYPNFIRVDSIGHSQQYGLPIWCARISNNASNPEPADKPKLLFIGQIHAEEVLGVMTTIQLARDLCSLNVNTAPTRFRDWRLQLEVYIIPTMNPEGLDVVMGTQSHFTHVEDISYRKNCRWNSGRLLIDPAVGYDTSGVDNNRNFPFNWHRGHPYLFSMGLEDYDYYRGPFAGSESETQAIMQLVNRIKPMYSIMYHSSRTGNLANRIYFSWDWNGTNSSDGKRNPDYALIQQVSAEMGRVMESQTEDEPYYLPSGNRSRNGCAHDWFYQAEGSVQTLIELGPRGVPNRIQPPDTTAIQWISQFIDGTYVMMNRALQVNPSGSYLTGRITDASNSANLAGAEVRILERHSRILAPRTTNSYGKFYRPLLGGSYTMEVRKFGYITQRIPNVILGDAQSVTRNVALTPLPRYNVNFRVTDNVNNPVTSVVKLWHPDTGPVQYVTNGQGEFSATLPADTFWVSLSHTSYTDKMFQLIIDRQNQFVPIRLIPAATTVTEGFEGSIAAWLTEGVLPWGTTSESDDVFQGSYAMGETPAYFDPPSEPEDNAGQTPLNSDGWLKWNRTFDFRGATDASTNYWIKGGLEPESDSTWVEITNDGVTWRKLPETKIDSMQFAWRHVVVSLSNWLDSSRVQFRWRIKTDGLLREDGIFLDEIAVKIANQSDTVDPIVLPNVYSLDTPYPNPFNGSLRIPFRVAAPGLASFRIFDLQGRTIREFSLAMSSAGAQSIFWNATNEQGRPVSSGVYFVEMKANQYQAIKKVMLLK
ncbi:MAG: M14 family zinc carboxypeptidase [bacterium]|nr:M14 family zinc carboxypeptidase [bacterium]